MEEKNSQYGCCTTHTKRKPPKKIKNLPKEKEEMAEYNHGQMPKNKQMPKLKIRTRSEEEIIRKVLIFGEDGTGKSEFATKYCKQHHLKPVCIDIDDTNYSGVDIVDINQSTDITTFKTMNDTIRAIQMSDYDTIILDGVSSLLELLTSKSKGLSKYSDRAQRFHEILRNLISSRLNLIFIGQIDMTVVYNEEHQSSKPIIKVNSIVNEKYRTKKEGDKFTVDCLKYRGNSDMLA